MALATDSSQHTASAPRVAFFTLLLLLSGFCGISYEVLYARILSNVIGDQFAVSASILVTFMLGIGFGTLYAHKLWRHLWLVEAAIGLFGASFAVGSGVIDTLYYGVAAGTGRLDGAMAFCFVLLIGPAFLIGCSLPLFAGYLGRLTTGAVFARAYMIYNFGAALTVLVIEFGLFRLAGLRFTVLTMAALNGLVGACLFLFFRALRERPEAAPGRLDVPRLSLLALAVASVASAVFQLLMIKLAECFLGPFRETFALVLAVVLLAIAIGSAFLRRVRVDLAWLLVAAIVGLAALLGGFEWVTRGYATLRPEAVGNPLTNVLLRFSAVALLMGLPVVAFGATVPALMRRLGAYAHDSGRLLFVSSLGNAAGFFLMAFALHRYLDYGTLIVVIGALTALALALALGLRARGLAAAAALLAVLIVVQRTRWDEDLLYLSYDAFHSAEDLAWYRSTFVSSDRFKGQQDVFSLNKMGDETYFFINGYVSINLESAPERIVGAFPTLFAPRTDKAFVLGIGSGITTGTVAQLFDHVDAVEINPVVIQNLGRMSAFNFDLPSRANANLVVDDGVHFARRTNEKYSLIISTLTSPRYFSASKLYTTDFFDIIKGKLTPDGVYVTWIDVLVGQRGLDIMLKTATESFPHCALGAINSGYFQLLCSAEPIRLRDALRPARSQAVAAYLRRHGLKPEWLAYGLITTRAQDAIRDPSVPLNTKDYPALEFQSARMDDRDDDFSDNPMERKMTLADVRAALEPALEFDPLKLVLHTEQLFGGSSISDHWIEQAEAADPQFAGRLPAARLAYSAWVVAEAGTADAHLRYADELLHAGRLDEAAEQARLAIARNPELADAYRVLGRAREKSSDPDAALANFAKAAELDPANLEAGLGVSRIHFGRRQYEQSLAALLRLEEHMEQPTSELYRYYALVFDALGRKRDASRARSLERELGER